MIDTHCHLNFDAFKDDWREAAERALEAGVTKMIVVGADLNSSQRAVELAQEHPALFASVGVHPHHAKQFLNSNFKFVINDEMTKLFELAKNPKVVAIGEIGLDYHVPKISRYPDDLLEITEELKETERDLFKAQLDIAIKLNKPVILHSREAKEQVLELLPKGIHGVFHCFGGSKGYAKRILEANLYIGFDGDITYVPDRLNVASIVPIDKLLTETDAPFLTPDPIRGQRNEPKNMTLILQAHANSRNMTAAEVDKQTTENAEKLFFVG